MGAFAWRINVGTYHHDRPFDGITPMTVHEGQRTQLVLVNQTPMYHPMHLHGHTFTVRAVGDSAHTTETPLPAGTRKDTVMVAPGDRLTVDFTADNPASGSSTATTPTTWPPAWPPCSPTAPAPEPVP